MLAVFFGGVGPEREVSLRSGEAMAGALKRAGPWRVEPVRLDAAELPAGLDPAETVVFPALHGMFGEDGRLQALLERAGFTYAGSDSSASACCMAKDRAKAVARERGLAVAEEIVFEASAPPGAAEVIERLGNALVIKPADQGSSVGLHFASGIAGLEEALKEAREGRWLIERRLRGRELTVGVLGGRAMGVVEIVSEGGVYDYAAKYTAGASEYRYPAELTPALTERMKAEAEQVFEGCGCRDFARVDFLLEDEEPRFLEVNTLPGLTATSLLPKSASCEGMSFEDLARELARPAVERFRAARKGGFAE
ncbi:MAG: D-alanine--D-alanine ligase [Opitutales bacterium]